MARTALAFLLAVLVAACLWYVIAPPKGVDGYRSRAANAADTVRSQVQTARITVDAVADGKLPHPAALVGFEEAEHDAKAAASQFEGFEPPSGMLALRDQFVRLTGEATEALGAIRIAAQQEDWERLPSLAEPLGRLADRLDRFGRRAQP